MKYFLMKQEEYEDRKFTYHPLKEVDKYTSSREFMIHDENKNNIWYCFVYEPNPKLIKIKKDNIKEMLANVSKENQENIALESFAEVSKELFFKFLKYQLKKLENKNESNLESYKGLKKIVEKIHKIEENNILEKELELNTFHRD